MQSLKPIPQVYIEQLSGSDLSNNLLDISSSLSEESSLGDVPKGFQLIPINNTVFSGSQLTYSNGTNSAIIYNSINNSGSVNYSFNANPTGSYCFQLKIDEFIELNSVEQINSIKFYNPSGSVYNVNLMVEFFS